MMYSTALISPSTSPRITLSGIKAIKILQQWNKLNLMRPQKGHAFTLAFHQLLHDISEFSASIQLDSDGLQHQEYTSELINLLLDASFGKYEVEKLNAWIRNHWRHQALLQAKEVIPYFYIFALEKDRRIHDRRMTQGCSKNHLETKFDERRMNRQLSDRRKFISF